MAENAGWPARAGNADFIAEVVARRYFAAIEKHDVSDIMALVADDMVMEYPFSETGDNSPGAERVYRGRDAIRLNMEQGLPLFRSIKFDFESFTLSADLSAVFVETRGGIVMSDGRAYRNRYIFRFDVREGKIIRLREYLNPVTSGLAFGRPIAGRRFSDPPSQPH